MAAGPEIRISPPRNNTLPVKSVKPTKLKPPEFISAARKRADRNYVPRNDLD